MDQVEEQHPAADIALGYRHNQTQVCLGHAVLGFLIALGHLYRKLYLLLGGQQRHLAYFLEVHTHRVVRGEAVHQRVGVVYLLVRDLLNARKVINVGEHIVDRREQIVSANVYIDAVFLQRLIELVDGFTVKVHFLKALQLLGSELADLFALFKQLVQALLRGLGVLLGRGVLFLGGLLFAAARLCGDLHVIRLFQQRVGHFAQFLLGVNMFF